MKIKIVILGDSILDFVDGQKDVAEDCIAMYTEVIRRVMARCFPDHEVGIEVRWTTPCVAVHMEDETIDSESIVSMLNDLWIQKDEWHDLLKS